MATFLRTLSYKYPSLYNFISGVAALSVGGETRFRQLAIKDLEINKNDRVLDLCCGGGQTTKFLVQKSDNVTGLDISPVALARAKKNVPQADYIEGLAQDIPLEDNSFDLVHTSAALHEMTTDELKKIFAEVYRILKPGGIFTTIDFHSPTNRLFFPGLAIFLWLFETETSWQLLKTDLCKFLKELGFYSIEQSLYVGGSLQVIRAKKN